MEDGIFTAGVMPGSPRNDFEIKFLICYLLSRVSEPVSFNQLATTFQETGYVNYFEFSSLLSEMLAQGHLRPVSEGALSYELTEHGSTAARQFHKTIPLSVRERCQTELERQLKIGRRLRENNVKIKRVEDGFTVTLEIPDIGTPLMGLTLFMPTRESCEEVKRRFLNDPLFLYKGIIALTTGDMRTVGHVIPSGETLFD